jgi:5-formyltetrahydrofolate cyclo-ligase
MTNEDIEKKSVLIAQKLLGLVQIAKANNVLLYLPVNGEVDTKYVLAHFQKRKIKIFLPAYLEEGKKWVIAKFDGFNNLEVGPFGVMQPRRANSHRVSSLDLAIVPVVAFSTELSRLGYGKGVYDRLLGGLKITKIGLAYEFQLVETLPAEPHDVKMDYVVTGKKIYTSRSNNI